MSIAKTIVLHGEPQAHALWALLKANWRAMADQGKPLAIQISEYKAKRTSDQNRLLHKLLTMISEQAWVGGRLYSMETWKEQVRRKFIGTEEVELLDGTRMERGISTTTLNTTEMADMIDRLQAWATSELGVDFDQR